jgi:hypothetical protein
MWSALFGFGGTTSAGWSKTVVESLTRVPRRDSDPSATIRVRDHFQGRGKYIVASEPGAAWASPLEKR